MAQAKRDFGFPRARGDGPLAAFLLAMAGPLPPRSRGWTQWEYAVKEASKASPALAGMDPTPDRARADRGRFPRARGDGPGRARQAIRLAALPPRSRGWTWMASPFFRDWHASPALAGMDPPPQRAPHGHHRFPRARGDGPSDLDMTLLTRTLPPRSRGWTLLVSTCQGGRDASPALAGMDLHLRLRSHYGDRFPRARGDGPAEERRRFGVEALPPRSRGWTQGVEQQADTAKASPALAGMDRACGPACP